METHELEINIVATPLRLHCSNEVSNLGTTVWNSLGFYFKMLYFLYIPKLELFLVVSILFFIQIQAHILKNAVPAITQVHSDLVPRLKHISFRSRLEYLVKRKLHFRWNTSRSPWGFPKKLKAMYNAKAFQKGQLRILHIVGFEEVRQVHKKIIWPKKYWHDW